MEQDWRATRFYKGTVDTTNIGIIFKVYETSIHPMQYCYNEIARKM